MKKFLFMGALLLICGQLLYSQTHHWPLTENLNDVVGDKHGTNNGVTFQNDAIRGPVAYFNGEAYANLPSFVNGLSEITIAIWYRMDVTQVWSRIYTFGNGDQTEPKDVLMIIPVGGNENMYRFTLSDPAAPWVDIDFPQEVVSVEEGTWYYSVVVLKGDSIILYHNDDQIIAEGGFVRDIGTLNDTENALGKSFWPDALWNGALSDLRVYNTALSQSEVLDLYNTTLVGIEDRIKTNVPKIFSLDKSISVKLDKPMNDELVSVYSVTGSLLTSKPVSQIESVSFRTGIYIVKVSGSNINYVSKVFVK